MQLRTASRIAALATPLMILVASASPAAADAPMPITMDRISDESRIGLDLGLVWIDSSSLLGGDDDFMVGRFDLSGQFVSYQGIGGYASVVGTTSLGAPGDDQSGFQGLEAGALWRLAMRHSDWWLRGGLILGTADDDIGGIIVNGLSSPARLTDIAKIVPDTTWLRLSTTPIFRSRQLVFRFDLGLDVPLDDDGADADPLFRANFGLGVETYSATLMFELVNIGDLDDDDGDDEFAHTLSFGARFASGPVEPHIAIGIPLDEDQRDVAPFFLLFGLSARL
jgi:hypothetical protein